MAIIKKDTNKKPISKYRKNKTENYVSEIEYLERELLAETKSEYHDGKIVAMAGTQPDHNRIVTNLIGEMYICLKKTECEIFPSDMLVHLPECKKYVFPDVIVNCETVEFMEKTRNGLKVLVNPQIIIEVSSKSTAEYDLGKKMTCYLKLKSLKQYVIISSEKKSIIIYTKDKNGKLDISSFSDEEDIKLGDCTIKIEDIYRKVDFEQNEGSENEEVE